MDFNLTAHYMALETSRSALPAKAERGWLVEQATAGHAGSARRHLGAMLVHAGERMQGLPRPALAPRAAERAVPAIRPS